ncbi:hypothetical protein [Acaryochloris marina]|uniref:Uncharacterized protein n=1 Tax=Acaryochloris marina (strain MBIC 11017) TaxID=329726 RepID=A8ZPL9_ACAM1|nr:hypothetical protein [Acaryochloris marina]ABW32955.1 hypothetical protein AM1_E0186 [Acaryochloris marina MBIC11017]
MSNQSFSKTLKTLQISKEDLIELRGICGLGETEEFSESDIEMLKEVVQHKQSGAITYTEAWQQIQAEVVPVEAEPVAEKSDGTDHILERAEKIADEDGERVLQTLDGYGDDLQKAVLGAYMSRLNHVFANARVQKAVVEDPDELAKKPGPFTSRLRERLAAQAKQTALPASTNSSTETLPTE